ncbi:hypothetical protein EDD18DRAFT_1333732 [Armillaria luteobubalina]|uniref:Protein kinase domain-containing protein n=1 Tax=Armillaria luteobubalina TaxID=153913 RepID=A0AA39Q0E4_9AGAR|nr:hypothetical protein EDD18DRAFT_1333732 [Armillaria luteobubalina]
MSVSAGINIHQNDPGAPTAGERRLLPDDVHQLILIPGIAVLIDRYLEKHVVFLDREAHRRECSLMDEGGEPTSSALANNSTPLQTSILLLQQRYLLRALHLPSTNVDVVTLVDEIMNCPFIPVCYGVFHRPAGGWFGFVLEDVGDNLEDVYGTEWSDVKRGHGDLEPRNVAQTVDGFKFFDFGRSKLHVCQRDECFELRNILKVYD